MLSRGIFYDKAQNRTRHKFVCPIKGSKKFAKDHPYCPWMHPKFVEGSGCYRYLRVDSDVRSRIDYGSQSFRGILTEEVAARGYFPGCFPSLCRSPP